MATNSRFKNALSAQTARSSDSERALLGLDQFVQSDCVLAANVGTSRALGPRELGQLVYGFTWGVRLP
jgi:hypothetical protein